MAGLCAIERITLLRRGKTKIENPGVFGVGLCLGTTARAARRRGLEGSMVAWRPVLEARHSCERSRASFGVKHACLALMMLVLVII